jgi:hypothetical protein
MFQKLIQKVAVAVGLVPVKVAGSTAVNGEIVDRLGYNAAVVAVNRAAATGSPSAAVATYIVQHGAAANLSDAATFATLATGKDVSAAGAETYPIDLRGAKRYIRVVRTPTFTDGTSPGYIEGCSVILGGKNVEPADTATVLP